MVRRASLCAAVVLWLALVPRALAGPIQMTSELPACANNSTVACALAAPRSGSDADFTAANLATGVNVLGVTGALVGAAAACANDATGACTLDATRGTSDVNFQPANIADGVNILGVTGALVGAAAACANDATAECTLDATRGASDTQFQPANIINGVNILGVTGAAPLAATDCTNDLTGACTLDATRATSDAQFVADNLATGVNVLGVTGTLTNAGDITTGLTHRYTFDETSGTSAVDSVGGHTGVVAGGAAWAPNEGIVGGALRLDGVDDYVSVATPALPTGDFTYSLWVDRGSGTGLNEGLWHASNGTTGEAQSYVSTTTLQTRFDSYVWTITNQLTEGWHLITITRIGEQLHVYQDGAQLGQVVSSAPYNFSTCSFFIGTVATCTSGATYFLAGLVDDLRIYSRGLAAPDVTKLYRAARDAPTDHSAAVDLMTGLTIHLPFDDATGTTAEDATANNHDGVLTNGPTWVAGHLGGAVLLDGTNDYIDVATPALPTGDYTYALWLKNTVAEAADTYLSAKSASGANVVALRLNRANSSTNGLYHNGVAVWNGPFSSTATTSWMHLAWTRQGKVTRMYINGRVVFGLYYATAITFSDCSLLIGTYSNATGCTATLADFLGGAVDDLRIYDRALTEPEIAALAAQ
jgi:hypothetical protein